MPTPSPFATEDEMSHFTLRQTPQPIQWAALLAASVVCVAAFELMRLPAALMLGAIGAAILLSWFEGRVAIPPWGFVIAQGFIGCLVARAITTDIVVTIFQRWPMFLTLIGAVIVFAAALGYVLTRMRVLPGTTAVWGSSAGAATAMVLMSDAFGGDMRLVAVMQYLRVACVGLVASLARRRPLRSSGFRLWRLVPSLRLWPWGSPARSSGSNPGFPPALFLCRCSSAPRSQPAICSRSRCRHGFWRSATRWLAGLSASDSRARRFSMRGSNCQ
jgi:membrane AbrB-like protein